MKKTFALTELDCANCAAKMEDAIRKIPGVESVRVNFLTQRMTLEAADDAFDAVLEKAIKAAGRVEPDCRIAR